MLVTSYKSSFSPVHLNLNGKDQSSTDFEDADLGTRSTVIGGRACPDNVYIDDANQVHHNQLRVLLSGIRYSKPRCSCHYSDDSD